MVLNSLLLAPVKEVLIQQGRVPYSPDNSWSRQCGTIRLVLPLRDAPSEFSKQWHRRRQSQCL